MKNIIKIFEFLIFLLIFFSGCQNPLKEQKDLVDVFQAKLFTHLMSTYDVSILSEDLVNTRLSVDRPALGKVPLLQFKTLGFKGRNSRYFCLYYRVPYLKIEKDTERAKEYGILKLIELDENEKCVDQMEREPIFKLENIVDLKFFLSEREIHLNEENKKIDPLTLVLKISMPSSSYRKTNFYWIEAPLLNIEKSNFNKRSNFFSSSTKNYYHGEFIVYSNLDSLLDDKTPEEVSIIKKDIVEWNENDNPCLRVDPASCMKLGENKCHLCRYQSFEVSLTSCWDETLRFCGPNSCGEKGMPACQRRARDHSLDGLSLDEVGEYYFCRKDLSLFINSKKMIICQ